MLLQVFVMLLPSCLTGSLQSVVFLTLGLFVSGLLALCGFCRLCLMPETGRLCHQFNKIVGEVRLVIHTCFDSITVVGENRWLRAICYSLFSFLGYNSPKLCQWHEYQSSGHIDNCAVFQRDLAPPLD
jgi:hypothetical protein